MILMALQPEQYDRLRGVLSPFIEKALNYADYDEKLVRSMIEAGRWLPVVLWQHDRPIAVLVCQLTPDAVHVVLMGGEALPKGWHKEVVTMLKALAKDQDKQAVSIDGRPAWKRLLHKFGFREYPVGKNIFLRVEV